MQKKQLRTFAIIALVAIFVVVTAMRLTIEPADLGKGYTNPGGTQVVETLPTDGETGEAGSDVDPADPGNAEPDDGVGTPDDGEATGDDNANNDDVSGGDDAAAVSGAQNDGKTDGKGDAKPGDKGDTKVDSQPADKVDDTTPDSGAGSASSALGEEEKPSSSAESGVKPGAWPPIPEQPVADPDNPQTYHCTMEIYCKTLLNEENIDNEAIIPYIPEDGVLLAKTTIEFTEGENAFDIILRACRANDIQFEYREDSMYSGAYVEGIGYLYEFDGGPLSGWMYKVNGQFPNYGCKRYIVQDGDAIVWMYTCDLGRDVGDNSVW